MTTEENGKKAKYDVNYILSPILNEEAVLHEVERMRGAVESNGGVIFDSEMPKLRPLAYDVSKAWAGKKHTFDQGQFGWIKCEILSADVPEIMTAVNNSEYMLRAVFTDAYVDVRPLRRIPGAEDKPAIVEILTEPVTHVAESESEQIMPPEAEKVEAKKEVKKEVPAEAPKKQAMSEAELDKQIDDLLS